MLSATKVPASSAAATLTLLYFAKLESGEVLAAFLCLALAHRARVLMQVVCETFVPESWVSVKSNMETLDGKVPSGAPTSGGTRELR